MANRSGVTEAAGVAVAERVAEAHALWLSTLPTIRRAPVRDRLPQLARPVAPEPATEPIVAPAIVVTGTICAQHGPIGDLAVSPDGSRLVAAHYGTDTVSIVDPATLSVTAAIEGVAEPRSVAVADRAYVGCASLTDDYVLAVDTAAGAALAAKPVGGTTASGLVLSPSGDRLYVARTGEDRADIAVIDVESGSTETIAVADEPGVSLGTLQISADGKRLFVAMTTPAGAALAVVGVKAGVVERTIALGESVADIAVHPDGRTVFATGWDAAIGGVIRVVGLTAARVTATIRIGGLPTQVVFGRGGNLAYVIDGDQILVVASASGASGEILDSIIVGGAPSCLATGPDGTLYVADYDGDITVLRVGAGDRGRLPEPMTAGLPQLSAAVS